jgi:alkanesulfonate monooxygenase SsuD/methylene tetrahydromethanopterin reductase-like flavin-dependent oxidoreductase (luciferase family)
MCDPDFYLPLALACEEVGFHTFTLPDSICYPQESDSKYPYNADGDREFLDGVPFLEPFTLVPAMGAITTKLHFSTSVFKLAIRQPAIVSKQLASVAVLTKNRFTFGVGISPWPDDFAACQIPWEGRGKRMDEMIEIVRGLLTGEYFGYHHDLPKREREQARQRWIQWWTAVGRRRFLRQGEPERNRPTAVLPMRDSH